MGACPGQRLQPLLLLLRRQRRNSSLAVLALSCCGGIGIGVDSFVSRYHLTTRRILAPSTVRCYSSSIASSYDEDAIANLPRVYTSSPLSSNVIVPLDVDQSNYLNVMRITNPKRWGSLAGHLRLFNGQDGEYLAQVQVADTPKNRRRSDSIIVECIELLRKQPSLGTFQIHLHMGRLKKPRRKWVLEKATELGVNTLSVIDTEYSTDAWEQEKHLAQIVEAAEQCERMTIPTLQETSWEVFLEHMKHEGYNQQWLICRERSPESLPLWTALQKPTNVTHIVVGPEGGWSPKELNDLQNIQQQRSAIHFVSLGSLVLRAETAAVAAISAVALSHDANVSTNSE